MKQQRETDSISPEMINIYNGNPSKIYYAEQNRIGVAVNLIHFSIRQFNGATCIRKLDELENIIVENGQTTKTISPQDQIRLRSFLFDGLIDSIRISICYENFIKALLLSHSCLVHEINFKHSAEFYKNQKKRPLYLKDYLEKHPFTDGKQFNSQVIPGLLNKTLGFKTITSPEYNSILKIPGKFISIIDKHYSKRNYIHFYTEEYMTYSKLQVDALKELKVFTNKNLVQNNNKFATFLGLPEDKHLKLEDWI